jgi:uncharacterized protein YkwD
VWSAPRKRVKYAVAGVTGLALVSGGLAAVAVSGHVSSARDRLVQQKIGEADLTAGIVPPSDPPTTSPAPATGPQIGEPAQAPAGGPSASPPAPKPKPKPKLKLKVPPPAESSVGKDLLVYVNTKRAAEGLYPYTMSDGLVKAANLHSQCMAAEHRLSHRCTSIGEKPIGQRFIGVPWRGAAENAGQENASDTPASILAAAKRSTDSMLAEGVRGGHYLNLMSKESKLIGIGVVRTSDGMVWLTQDFVTPP